MTRVLRENGGVISLAGLRTIGFSADEVAGFVSHGDLRRLHRGVYADGRIRLSEDAHLRAALLAVPGNVWLAGRTAAAVWGLRAVSLVQIEVCVVASCTPKRRGVLLHRVSEAPHRSEIKTRRGLRLSSVARMLFEVAHYAASDELDALIEASIRRDVLNFTELEATLERHHREPGVGKVGRAIAGYRPMPKRRSGLERSFDRWLLTHPEIPEPQRNVKFAGTWELDCYWPEHRLVLELDGRPYHIMGEDIERDRRKDAWLQRNGLRVLRVTDLRWKTDRAGVHGDLMALLALGRLDSGGLSRRDNAVLPQSD
ncbi:MAG TPA: DUF559 domain-containing protein [Solirubrobacteraceae bacterium]|nr:DUF559 domain-containing protein [Solirubrobacteraceae bacterium]